MGRFFFYLKKKKDITSKQRDGFINPQSAGTPGRYCRQVSCSVAPAKAALLPPKVPRLIRHVLC